MKIAFLAFALLCATAAFGQTGQSASALSNQAQPLQMQDHPEHASQRAMASEQSLFNSSETVMAHGERPLWEVAEPKAETPLGDSARMLRKEHAGVKKAKCVWHN
jgi:uncharacterized MAPEG superfamily protein